MKKTILDKQDWIGKRFPFEKIDYGIRQAYFATISPEQAYIMLKQHNICNRNKLQSRTRRYSSDLNMGLFMLNGETIIFDKNEVLMNGQHRLQACVDSNISFNVILVFGIDSDAMPTIDTGKNRSFGDWLRLEGVKNSAISAATTKLLLQFSSGGIYKSGGHGVITSGSLKLVFKEFRKDFLEYANLEHKMMRETFQPSEGLFLLILLKKIPKTNGVGKKSKISGDEFLTKIAYGENLTQSDILYKLRKWLLKNRLNRRLKTKPVTTNVILNTVIKVFNHKRGITIENDDFIWNSFSEKPQIPDGITTTLTKKLKIKIDSKYAN
jgi:hypothetical protein